MAEYRAFKEGKPEPLALTRLMNHSNSKFDTNQSLLGRLRFNPGDEQSWNEFVNLYGAMILRWCLKWGLQIQDAEEVTQNVLLQLAQQLKDFKYDPAKSFRSWLKTIARRTWYDFVKSQIAGNRRKQNLSLKMMDWIKTEDAAEEFFQKLEEEFQKEKLKHALRQVQLRVEPQTWKAFEQTAMQGLPVIDVAKALEMNVASVYVAKSRVVKMLKRITASINDDEVANDEDTTRNRLT